MDVPGGLGVDEGGVRMLPVVADHVVDPDARDLVGLAEAKQRAGHALRAAELVDVAALRHDLGLRAGILRDPHVAAVALVLIGDRLRAVVGGNGAEGKAQSGGDAGKPCGEVHFDLKTPYIPEIRESL